MTTRVQPNWWCSRYPDGTRIFWEPAVLTPNAQESLKSMNMHQAISFVSTHMSRTRYHIEYPGSEPAQSTDPRDKQVGGDHYKNLSVEPWAAMEAWLSREEYIGYLRGNIIKYHARANSGKEDKNIQIAKAKHYADELDSFLSRSKPAQQ